MAGAAAVAAVCHTGQAAATATDSHSGYSPQLLYIHLSLWFGVIWSAFAVAVVALAELSF